MILLLIFIVVVVSVIAYVIFRTPEIPADHPENKPQIPFDAEKKYVESLRILNSMSENVQKPSKPRVSITLNNLLIDNNLNFVKTHNAKDLVNRLTTLGDVYIFYKGSKENNPHQTIVSQFQGIIPPHVKRPKQKNNFLENYVLYYRRRADWNDKTIKTTIPYRKTLDNIFVIERLAPHLNQIISLTSTQNELKELSASDVRRSNILNHNIDFFNQVEEIFNYVGQIIKTR